jgi:hypothetical protein
MGSSFDMANNLKALEKYLITGAQTRRTSLEAYSACPAEAFLSSVCDAHDAFVQCLNKFTKKQDGTYNKDASDSLREISLALLGAMMGHFETFQKAIFAGLVERSATFPNFSTKSFISNIGKNAGADFVVSPDRLLAFRSAKAPVGFVMADSLYGWHNPEMFNARLKAFGMQVDYFSKKEVSDLEVLWQLRHSIVHTGAWLTEPDAQKITRLRKFGNTGIAFEPSFVNAVSRRLHRIVKAGNARTEPAAVHLLGANPPAAAEKDIRDLFAVRSPKKVWLK